MRVPLFRRVRLFLGAFLIFGSLVRAADARFPFVIPGDDASPSITSMAALSPHAAGADGFVRVQDGHFFTDAGRFRIWGVNTCFGANFPEHADAEKVAAHLAKLGVNAVRMHHHDTSPAPRGIWAPVKDGGRHLDAGQLEKQDYFLNELNRHGIFANLNLHVGREVTEAEGFLRNDLPYATRMDKYLLYFEPRLREQLKDFAREYLLHENPYRKLRRVDDPGIAMIEITNENSFSKFGPDIAANLPEPHRGEFKRQWNAWLARNYASTAALTKAWSGANEPLGATLADSKNWGAPGGAWRVSQNAKSPVQLTPDQTGPAPGIIALRITLAGAASDLHAQELQRPNLQLEPGKIYTLSFWARANAVRSLLVDVSNQGPGNWNPVGFQETLQLGTEWRRVHRVFRASEKIPGAARICFKFGGSPIPFELADLTLRRGGDWIVAPAGQTIEARNVEIPVAGWSELAQRDVRRFMAETEQAFITDLVTFLKKDLGVRVPITASQITYHTPEIVAATCDYADIHAYWQHPRFPHKPWDPVDWNIPNTPMERGPDSDALLSRAPWRLLDRPFTMSEWNIPDPNDYAASTVPFAAMIAALQDWDGIFFFQYQSGGENGWYADKVQHFFSLNGQPAKLALFTACANLFRRGDLAPLPEVVAGTSSKMVPATEGLRARIGIDPKSTLRADAPELTTQTGKRLASADGRAVWDARDPSHARVVVNTAATRAAWGLIAGQSLDLGGIQIAVGAIDHDYAAIVCTSSDGQSLEKTRRALLVAVGSAENAGMEWNETRTSVGNQWGSGPAQVNAVNASLTFTRSGAHLYALDGRGERLREVTSEKGSNGKQFQLGAQHRTLWYEIEW